MPELSEEQIESIKNNYPKKVGKRIKELRLQQSLTQTKLVNLTGKDRLYVYKIEKMSENY